MPRLWIELCNGPVLTEPHPIAGLSCKALSGSVSRKVHWAWRESIDQKDKGTTKLNYKYWKKLSFGPTYYLYLFFIVSKWFVHLYASETCPVVWKGFRSFHDWSSKDSSITKSKVQDGRGHSILKVVFSPTENVFFMIFKPLRLLYWFSGVQNQWGWNT